MSHEIVPHHQNTDEWLEWRKGGICASEIAVICGESPFAEPYDIYAQKVEGVQPFVSPAMQRGKDFEPEARAYAGDRFNTNFLDCCVQSKEAPEFRASLDGWSLGMVLEIKVPSSASFLSFKEPPKHYVMQVQWQLMITGEPLGVLFYYYPETKETREFFIHTDSSMQDMMAKKAKAFWRDHILSQIPPDRSIPFDDDEILAFYTRSYALIDEEIKELTERKKKLREDILACANQDIWKNNDVTVFKSSSTAYDYDAMQKDGIHLDKYKKKSPETTRIRVLRS